MGTLGWGQPWGPAPQGWHCQVNEGSRLAPPAASERIQGLASDYKVL